MPETRSGAQTAEQEISARQVAEALNLKLDAYQEQMDKRLSEMYEAMRQMTASQKQTDQPDTTQSSSQDYHHYNTRHSRSVSAMKTAKGKDKAKEALKPVDDRKVGKRKAPTEKLIKQETRKGKKSKRDPNKPKRSPSAFQIFYLYDFTIANPDVRSFPLFYAAAKKWGSMSQAEKAPYEEKAANWNAEYRKLEYKKLVDAYNKNIISPKPCLTCGVQKKGSDEPEKSRSDVNDEDEAIDEEEQLERKAGDEGGNDESILAANWNAEYLMIKYKKLVDAYNKNIIGPKPCLTCGVQKKGSDEPEKSRSDVNDEDEAIDEEEQLERKAGDEGGNDESILAIGSGPC